MAAQTSTILKNLQNLNIGRKVRIRNLIDQSVDQCHRGCRHQQQTHAPSQNFFHKLSVINMYAVLGCRKIIHSPPAHLKTQEREYQQKAQSPPRSPSHKSQMNIKNITKPSHKCPGLFSVPTPVMPPCLLCPYCTRKHAEGKEGSSYVYQGICCLQCILP